MSVKLGEYILQKPIGKGAMGQVWLARQESLDRMVAVKVLPKELAGDPSFRARFEREAKAAAALIHPNVIQIYSFGIEQNVPYFAMEFVRGEDLSVKIRKGQKYTIREAVKIASDVARALECAHERNLVHRDIKPGNIMIAHNGVVKVMDFGLAKAASAQSSITQPGLIMGTPSYMSPEQGMGKELDVRSDMYSVGVVLYKLLTGEVPFTADTPTAVIFRHIYEEPKSVRELNPEVPEELERIVNRLMAKSPDDRYRTPTELIADLEAFLGGTTTTTAAQAAPAAPPVAAPASSEPTMRTEAIGDKAVQRTSATEPILAPAQPTTSEELTAPLAQVSAPAQGQVKTQEDELQFLEDLLQGESPGAMSRAADIFARNPGLRDSYVRQQFVHALLRSQVDMQDRAGRQKRVTRVLSMVGPGTDAAVEMATLRATGGGAGMHSRRPMLRLAVIAGIIIVMMAVVLIMMIPGLPPELTEIMDKANKAAATGSDRAYTISVKMHPSGQNWALDGSLYMRGLKKSVTSVLTPDGKSLVLGSDGETDWVVAPGGSAYFGEHMDSLRTKHPGAAEMPLLTLERLLPSSGGYVVSLKGEGTLENQPGRKLVQVRAMARPGKEKWGIEEGTYWIDKESGLLVRAVLTMKKGPTGVTERYVTVEFSEETKKEDYFYSYTAHSTGERGIFRDSGSSPEVPGSGWVTPPEDNSGR